MSDEPKKRSRVWILWAVAALFALYPLSIGPATRLVMLTNSDGEWLNTIYAPVLSASERPETAGPLLWYLDRWGALDRPVSDPDPE